MYEKTVLTAKISQKQNGLKGITSLKGNEFCAAV